LALVAQVHHWDHLLLVRMVAPHALVTSTDSAAVAVEVMHCPESLVVQVVVVREVPQAEQVLQVKGFPVVVVW